MPPPDQPERPKPRIPAAALEAMAAREAAAKAKAAAGAISPPSKVVAAPPPPPAPTRPGKSVGLAGFGVWFVALVAALSLFWNFKANALYGPWINPRMIAGEVLGGIMLLAIWFTQAIEKDARLVKLMWVVAVGTIVFVGSIHIFNWLH